MPAGIKELFYSLITQALLGVHGFRAWVLAQAMKYGGQYLYSLVSDWIDRKNRSAVQEIAQQKYQTILADPKSTVEEIGEAYQNFINAGK